MNGWKKKIYYNNMMNYKIKYVNQNGGKIETMVQKLESNLKQQLKSDEEINKQLDEIKGYIQLITIEDLLDLNTKVQNIMIKIWGRDFLGIRRQKKDVYNNKMFLLLDEINKRYQNLQQTFERPTGNRPISDLIISPLNIHNIKRIYTDSTMLQLTQALKTVKKELILQEKVKLITFTLQNPYEITYHNSLVLDSQRFVYDPIVNSKLVPIRLWGILSQDRDKLLESAGANINLKSRVLYLKSPNLELEGEVDQVNKFSLDFLRHKMIYGIRLYKSILNHKIFSEDIEFLRLFTLDIQMILNLQKPFVGTNKFYKDAIGTWAIWYSLIEAGIIEKKISKQIIIYTSNFNKSTIDTRLSIPETTTNIQTIDLDIPDGTFKVIVIDGKDQDILHATFTNSAGYFGYRELYRIHTGFLLTKFAKDILINNDLEPQEYLTPSILKYFLSENLFGVVNKDKFNFIQTQISQTLFNYGGLN